MTDSRILVILGPTASGKSALAVQKALEQNGEIINCDSMQVYCGLSICTAQPEPEMLQAVPHHLVNFLDFHLPWDVNLFLQACQEKIAEIRGRGKNVVIVGGTGLYAKSLVYGHHLLPADKTVFAEIEKTLQRPDGKDLLLQELERACNSPEDIPRDLRQNPRRLLRACEVLRLTGKTPWQLHPPKQAPAPEFHQLILMPEFDALKERIRRRAVQMMKAGWVEEVRLAIQDGILETPTARQVLGVRDIAQYLEGTGAKDLSELTTLLANRTIQYARRQMTWFKHQHPGADFIC